MKIIKARKEKFCSYGDCAAVKHLISKDDLYISILYKKEGRFKTLLFHKDCYFQSIYNMWDEAEKVEEQRKLKKKDRNKGGKQGRPRKYSNPFLAGNLLSLLRYHKKHNNIIKVDEIEIELKLLIRR